MRYFAILFVSILFVSVSFAADPPKKPVPPSLPPAPLYPPLPPNLTLPPSLDKSLVSIKEFLDKTEAAFKVLNGNRSGEVEFDRQLLSRQLFANIALARAQLLYMIDPSSIEVARAMYDLLRVDMGNQRFIPRDASHPQYGAHLPYFNVLPDGDPKDLKPLKQSLLPAIADKNDANSTLRYTIEMLAAVNTADAHAQTALTLLNKAGAMTRGNIDAAFSRGMINRNQRMDLITALTPAIDPASFEAAASRPRAPQLIVPPRPDATSLPRNPFNSLGGGGDISGTRFLNGMPGYLQLSPRVNFTPVYIAPPIVANPVVPVIPRIGTP